MDLAAEGFDLALRVALRLPDDDLLVARRMGDLPAHLYASPAYLKRHGTPAQPDDLRQHNVLGQIDSGGQSVPWQLTQAGSKWSWTPETALTANAPSFLRDLATHGMGIVALPDRMAKEWVDKGFLPPRIARLATPDADHLVCHTRQTPACGCSWAVNS